MIDLSPAAATQLGMLKDGQVRARVSRDPPRLRPALVNSKTMTAPYFG